MVDIRGGWLKDMLHEYVEIFSSVSSLLEKNIDSCIYGQTGFEDKTYLEMWKLYRKHKIKKSSDKIDSQCKRAFESVRRWTFTPIAQVTTTSMKRFRLYILTKDKVS